MQKKPASRIFRTVLIGFLFVILGVVAGGYVYVNQAGGLRRLLETELKILAGNAHVSVGAAKLGFSTSAQPLTVQASDIVIALDDSQIDLPSIDLKFGLASLFNGHPEAVVLRGAKLDLVRQDSGWSGSAELIFLGQIAARSSNAQSGTENVTGAVGRLGGIKRISVETDRLSLSDASGKLPKIVFADISVDMFAPDDTAISGSMRARRLDADSATEAGSFTIAFEGWPGADDFRLNVSASNFQTNDVAGYIDGLPGVFSAPGTLSGHLGVDVKAGQLATLNADIDLAGGRFEIPANRQNLEFDSAKLIFTYARDAGRLTVTKAELDMSAARAVRFSGSVDQFHAFSPVVDGRIEANGIALRTLVENWPSSVAPTVRQAVEGRFSGGVFKRITIGVQGVFDRENSQLNLSKIDMQSQFSGVRASLDAGQYKRMVATLDGKMGLQVGAGGRLQDASLELAMKDGSMLLAGHPKMVSVEGGQVRAGIRGNKIALDSFALDFGAAGSFDMDGSLVVGDGWTLQDLELGLAVPDMDIQLFAALWPEWAASKTRGWIDANIPSGRVRAARLALAADLDTPDEVRKIHAVSGDLKVRDAQMVWQKGAPPLTKVDADLHWDNDEFTATFLKGRFGGVVVQRGRMVIAPVLERVTKNAALTFTAKGDIKTALEIAGHVGIRKFGTIDFTRMDASGTVEFALQASIPLGETASLRETVKKFDMTISNGRFDNLPRQMTLRNAELVLNIGEASSQITGTADVYGAASSFSIEIDHRKNHLELVGQAPPSARLARALASITGMEIGGKIGGKIAYSGDPNIQDASLSMALNLAGTSVVIPQINWTKKPEEDGRATLSLGLRNGVLTKLTDIDINAGSLSAAGQVIFGASGQVQAALFERAVWPGNDLQGLIIERGAQSSWKVGATARRVDLSQIRRNKGASGGKAIEFDFTGDQIVIDDIISLSGQLVGTRDRLGAGAVEFLGTVLVKDKPLIAEAKLDMRFGPAGETMIGAGLIGGAEARVDFRALDGADPQLVIESDNAGRVLIGLGVTETVRGGVLRMITSFKDATFSNYDTEIRVSKFSVVEAPRALRLFSVLSPIGLYSLVEGDGTAFRHGQAIFETRGKMVKITSLMGTGDSVAVRIVGLYDRSNGKIDVSGNLVPASLLNRFLTGLPVIGSLITGADNSGVLVTQFKMTGSIDNPKTKIDPVSSLAPGVLRDLVSPDWIGKEEKRLFGDAAADTTQPAQTAQ